MFLDSSHVLAHCIEFMRINYELGKPPPFELAEHRRN